MVGNDDYLSKINSHHYQPCQVFASYFIPLKKVSRLFPCRLIETFCAHSVLNHSDLAVKILEKRVSFSRKKQGANKVKSIASKVLSRIYGRGRGWAFSSNDFVDEFNRDQIDNALSDLVKDGKIRRVCRGIYDYPEYSVLLGQKLSPDFDQVALAFARKFNWRIQPSGDAALNLLGLSTQVPGRFVYLSDGPTRKYSISSYTLEFKKSALKDVGFKHRESGMIVQAIKALGKGHISIAIIISIRKQLDPRKCKQIIKDTKSVTSWIYNYIKQICMECE